MTHTHLDARAGVYTVTLSAGDGIVTDTLTRTNYITAYQPVTAEFTASPLTRTVPLTVTFTNLSTPTQVITSALWAYGDGVISNTLALTHTHTYTRAGVYTVTLSVSDGVVTDTLTRSNYITATGGTVYTTTTRVITYTYDKLYRLTDAEYSTGEEFSYAYDPVGNRTVQTRTLTSTTVITYAYDVANWLVNVDRVDYTWDANGNLLSDGVRTFTYDAANRLTSVTSGTLTTTFEYDGLGNRTAQTVDGTTTRYALDVAAGLPEVIVATVGGGSTRYVQVQGLILGEYEAGAWGYVLPDALGSVRQLVDAAGQMTLAQSYDPFGASFETSGSGESDFGYTGEWWDSEAELLYLRARYYDPGVGRLLSKDRFSGDSNRPQTLSGWDYVENNPTNLVDSTGFYSMKEIKGFFHNAPTYLDVLRYFEPGGHLEGRWGWLKVLRKAEDGDRILVIMNSLNYCGPGVDVCIISPDCLANISPIREDVSGVFQKTENMLMVIPEYPHSALSHFEVASEGDRYQIQKNTHVLHNYPYPGMDYYDPLIESWEWKADAIATQKYVGLRHDPALASFGGAMSSLAGIIAPDSVEELLAIAEQVFDEAIRNGMVDAQGEFTQEVSMQLMKQLAKRLDPKVLAATELLDLALDINELKTDLGFIVAP